MPLRRYRPGPRAIRIVMPDEGFATRMGVALADPPRLASALLGRAIRVRPGENLIIQTWSHTLPFASACVVEARRRGANPMLLLEDEEAYWRSLDAVPSVDRWAKNGRHVWAALAATHAYVFFPGPGDRPRFHQLPSDRRRVLGAMSGEWHRRAQRARARGVRCLLGYVSDAQARHWGVNATEWRAQLVAGAVDPPPGALQRNARRVVPKLKQGRSLRITGANGTDLTVRLRGRSPVPDDGVVSPEDMRVGRNLTASPAGSVIVAVDERNAEGVLVANRPSFLRGGRAEGGQWEVRGGRLINHWYTENQAAFDEPFDAAPKGRDIVSLFSIGLNSHLPPGVPQVEDQEAGAIALGVGGNASFGGNNRCPFFSWAVLGEATVAVDGKPLCDRGQIL